MGNLLAGFAPAGFTVMCLEGFAYLITLASPWSGCGLDLWCH